MPEVKEQGPLGDKVLSMLNDGRTRAEIVEELLAKGHEERFVRELLAETMKLRDTRRRAQALILILSGAVICFLSFLLTITSSTMQGHFSFVLYGLTSIGILVVFAGFVKVF